MSIYRVPTDKDTKANLEELKERVDKLPYTVNFAVDNIAFAQKELDAKTVKNTGGVVSGVLSVKHVQVSSGGTLNGDFNAGGNISVTGTLKVGAAPAGTEKFRSENARITSLVVESSALVGAAPSGGEKLRSENFKTTSATVTGNLSAAFALIGTSPPAGSESLRADSARLSSPVLLGNVPQFTMAANPSAAMHVATKQYVDGRAAELRLIHKGNAVVGNKLDQRLMGASATFTSLRAHADVAPSGASLNIRVNVNGVQVATLSIPSGSNSASSSVSINVAAGDRVSFDVTQVGSTTPGGNDLMVTLS